MDYLQGLFRRNPPPPSSFLEELNQEFSLSFTKRIMLFAITASVGIFFLLLAMWSIIFPTTFAKYYTLGTLFIISSTFFLVGPSKQIRSMFHPTRAVAAAAYFGSMISTLFCALRMQSTLLTLVMIVVQVGSAAWYGASYIPFAQDCLRGTARTVLPL